jgi:hypothetical protein
MKLLIYYTTRYAWTDYVHVSLNSIDTSSNSVKTVNNKGAQSNRL